MVSCVAQKGEDDLLDLLQDLKKEDMLSEKVLERALEEAKGSSFPRVLAFVLEELEKFKKTGKRNPGFSL